MLGIELPPGRPGSREKEKEAAREQEAARERMGEGSFGRRASQLAGSNSFKGRRSTSGSFKGESSVGSLGGGVGEGGAGGKRGGSGVLDEVHSHSSFLSEHSGVEAAASGVASVSGGGGGGGGGAESSVIDDSLDWLRVASDMHPAPKASSFGERRSSSGGLATDEESVIEAPKVMILASRSLNLCF